jgi:glycogen phosphorylase
MTLQETRAAQKIEKDRKIAYFSMEIALDSSLPTYSGGLGVLAGDTIRSAASLRVPMVAVTLLYRKGYFFQKLAEDGTQQEFPVEWNIENFLVKREETATMTIEGNPITIGVWEYQAVDGSDYRVPVYFLDTDIEGNQEWHRTFTDTLYGGDKKYRLCQEAVLGIGGVKILRAMGYEDIERFHMNEGHASLLTLELLHEQMEKQGEDVAPTEADFEAVQEKCVFTTHTPVPAGHDKFPMDLVKEVLGDVCHGELENVIVCDGMLNMTYLALNFSNYVNGVARKHGEVSRLMFAGHQIDAITNGVYAPFWVSDPFQELFDENLINWREDNYSFRSALSIPLEQIWESHLSAKKLLIDFINEKRNISLDLHALTIGFARRSASYKRADLLFWDIERLKEIVRNHGPLQVIYGGKAHPRDEEGKALIRRIFEMKEQLKDEIKIVYLPNYNVQIAHLMVAGVDVWLNTPRAPMEASGTSGMKAALNGVPSLSVLDGWWIEGCLEGVTGWAIGKLHEENRFDFSAEELHMRDREDAESLLYKLDKEVLPLYYGDREGFIKVMRNGIALNGAFFNTQRMVQQYVLNAYYR